MTPREIDTGVKTLAIEVRGALAIAAEASTITDISASGVGELTATLGSARNTLGELMAALGPDLSAQASPPTGPNVLAVMIWQRALLIALVELDGACQRALSQLSRLIASPIRQVIAREGDTLQMLAVRHLGDFRRWPEVASLNNLQPGATPVGALWVPTR